MKLTLFVLLLAASQGMEGQTTGREITAQLPAVWWTMHYVDTDTYWQARNFYYLDIGPAVPVKYGDIKVMRGAVTILTCAGDAAPRKAKDCKIKDGYTLDDVISTMWQALDER